MSQDDLEDLKYAKELLEHPGLAARITDALGTAIDKHDFYRSFSRHGWGHFIIRRLERVYGTDKVKRQYVECILCK